MITLKQALYAVWYASNQICSKRLVPFLPDLVEVMERYGHLNLPPDVRDRLLDISHSTVDRLLKPERKRIGQSISTTSPGSLFKHQIKVRTFADWDDVTPGFLEADLVAHCGGNTNGSFLNTLVLIDISTGWLECLPLLRKSAENVIIGLNLAKELLPFPWLGLDTDNGSEFINHDLLGYCEDNRVTFTRSRAYRKNDQAHVEEKNGSVVRRLVGYDRFEGVAAWEALSELYSVLRIYVNFFQPSLKLLSKKRQGAKVTKKYEPAKTPFKRVLMSESIPQNTKEALQRQYQEYDPVVLLERLERLQNQLWEYAWGNNNPVALADKKLLTLPQSKVVPDDGKLQTMENKNTIPKLQQNRRTEKKDLRKEPRTWRTRKDPFEEVWDELKLKLELNPEHSAATLLDGIIKKYSERYKQNQLRTLQRKVAKWREEQLSHEERLRAIMQATEPTRAHA